MGLREEVLMELATEYKKTRDPVKFEMIIMRVDKLLLHAIHKLMYTHPLLKRVPLEDLYHTSIVGLHEALITFHPKKGVGALIGRIFAYVNKEVFKTYRRSTVSLIFKMAGTLSLSEKDVDEILIEDERSRGMDCWSKELELEFATEDYKTALLKKIITKKEWKLLTDYYCRGLSSTALAEKHKCSGQTIRTKLVCTVLKIRNFMENSSKRS